VKALIAPCVLSATHSGGNRTARLYENEDFS
jgi:hypothetical protein